jgi:hypothetical protein
MNFIDAEDIFYDTSGFEALSGKIYALEAEFTAKETDFLQVSVSTDNNISLIGTQTDTFNFVDNLYTQGKQNLSIARSVTKDSKEKVRFYFIGEETGGVELKFIASGNAHIEKDIFFSVVDEKKLLVELSSDTIQLGKDFSVKVYDEGLGGVENAFIKILNKKGEVIKSVKGNSGNGTGLNGIYKIENTLDAGLYTVEVSAQKYATETLPFLVSIQAALSFPETIQVKMQAGQKNSIATEPLQNQSELSVGNLSYKISDTDNFNLTAVVPPTLGAGQKSNVQLNIEYVGSAQTLDEEFDLTITGYIEGKFLVETHSKVNIIYNRQLNPSCLVLEPSTATINLEGTAGQSGSTTIQATNNCEEVLHLTKTPVKKNNIIVDSKDIDLQPGQTKNVEITAINLIPRGIRLSEDYTLNLEFDSNALTKRVSVKVNLVNPNFALSCPGQVTLWMTQNAAGQKATAAQPLYITNNSAYPIENLNFSIQGSSNGTKLSIEPSGAVNLGAGQAITPAKVVFAQGNTTLTEPVQQTIVVTGRMGNLNNRSGQRDSYNYYNNYNNNNSNIGYNPLSNYNPSASNYASSSNNTLCTIQATLYHSGFDCLKVNVVNDLSFNLNLEGISNSKKISIQNNCAEPVRIVSATAQANGLQLGVQPIIVPAGQLAHSQLSVGSTSPTMKLNNYPIFIHGITEVSQTPIKSEGLNISVSNENDYRKDLSKALTGLTVNECVEGEEDREITINVPKVSSDCSAGYCDAVDAAEYVAKKLDTAIRKAESYGYSKQSQSETFGCETQGFCTFAQVGMKEEIFELYLKNDILSIGALREALKEKTSNQTSGIRGGLSSGDFRIETTDVSDETINFLAGSGYNIPTIFIDEDIVGCGYYKLKIDGAFPVAGNFLSFATPVMIIRAIPINEGQSRITTPECIDDITNLVNFTPVDAGLTVSDDKGTWLTTIFAEPNLKALGEKLATEHFKDKSRLTTQTVGNKIRITESALSGALAQMCILGGEKKLIEVKVNSNISGMNETEKEAFQKSLSKMISDGLQGTFGTNCLVKSGDGYNCVQLTNTSDVGRLKLDIPDKIMIFSQSGGCVFGDISSPIPESITFSIEGHDNEIRDFQGIKRITIEEVGNSTKLIEPIKTNDGKDTKDSTILESAALAAKNRKYYYEVIFEGSNIKTQTAYPLELTRNQNSKDKRFKRDVKICAYPALSEQETSGESTYIQANGVTFIINAMNKNAGEARGTPDADGTIKINAGTIHPNDLIKLLSTKKDTFVQKGEDRPYYFTINWNDSSPVIENFEQYALGMNESGEDLMQSQTFETKDGEIITNEKTDSSKTQGKKKAIYSYLGYCAATTAACNIATGVGNQVLSVLADCAIPAATIFRKDFAQSNELVESFYEWASDLPLIGGMFEVSNAPLPDPKSWNPIENPLIAGGTLGAIERQLVLGTQLGARGGLGIHNTSLLSDTATALKPGYKEAAETMIQSSFTDLDAGVIAKFSDDYSTFMAKEFEKYFKAGYDDAMKKKSFTELTRIKSKVLPASEVQKIIAKAQSETQNSANRFFRQPLSRTDPTTYIDHLTSNGGRRPIAATSDEILEQLAPGSQLARTVSGTNPLNNLDSAISTRLGDFTPGLSDQAILSRAKGSVSGLVDDLTSGLGVSSTQKTELTKAISSKLDELSAGRTFTSNRVITQGASGSAPTVQIINGAAAIPPGAVTELIADTDSIRALVRDSITDTINTRNYDDMFKLTTTQLDDIGKAMTDGLGSSIDDISKLDPTSIVAKKGLANRVGSLFKNGKFWGAIARGAACGIAANAVGIHYYKKSMEKSNETLHNKAAALSDIRFEKGQTYKMIIEKRTSKDRIDATYEKVEGDLVEEMVKALGNKTDKGKIGTQLTWNTSLHTKKPEERKLSVYLLKDAAGNIVSTESLKTRLQDSAFDLKKEEIDEIMDNIRSSTSQTLIHRYGVQKPVLNHDNEIFADIIKVAPIVAALGDDFKESEKEAEIDLRETKLKDLILKLLKETGDGAITEKVAKEVFDEDPKKADILYKVSLAWGDLF